MATTAAPYGFWATNPTKKLAYWVYLLGQPLSRNRVFQNFSGEPPPLNALVEDFDIALNPWTTCFVLGNCSAVFDFMYNYMFHVCIF